MYQAKAAGRNSHHFFTHELSVKAIERAQIESGLKRALEHNALQVCYQPQIDISSGRIIGAGLSALASRTRAHFAIHGSFSG